MSLESTEDADDLPALATNIVLHIPHDSTFIPPDIRDTILLSDDALQQELIAMTDSFTAELFDFAPDVPRVVFPVSRLIVDPERFVDDAREPMAACGMGVIYTATSQGTPLRAAPTPQERTTLLDRFYDPHHHALTQAVNAALTAFGSCVIIDCHSFPSSRRAYELDQSVQRPDICLGTDSFHTPGWLTALVANQFMAEGYSLQIDSPYAGSLVPSDHYGSEPRVSSIMVEINRRMYMDEASGERLPDFDVERNAIHRALTAIRHALAVPSLSELYASTVRDRGASSN
jgi:N-formylglutamate amidohydrolase